MLNEKPLKIRHARSLQRFVHTVDWHLWLRMLGLITFAWELSVDDFRVESFVWELSLGTSRLRTLAWEL